MGRQAGGWVSGLVNKSVVGRLIGRQARRKEGK